jgi:threonine/homoserine/homoserine lactone efflux protein
MLELAGIFGGSFALALSGALMPGPLFTITISESVRHGFKAGPLLMIGHSLLELVLVVAVVQGLGVYLELPSVMGIIALLGGSLLIYFGIDMIRTAGSLSLAREAVISGSQYSNHPILLGVVASASNPYWILWWATIGLGYLAAVMQFGVSGVVIFFLGHIAADFAWYCLVSFGMSRGKSLLKDWGYQSLIRICGVFLFCFGGWFLISAKNFLMKASFGLGGIFLLW